GRPHHAPWIHGLVAGYEYEAADPVPLGGFRCEPGARYVVLDRLTWIVLHQGHVFVRGHMEDDLRPVFRHDRVEARDIGHVTHDRMDESRRTAVNQIGCDGEQIVLAALVEHEGSGTQRGDLAAQLRPDRAA